ncbi:hypothetical protein [Streptomyces sp. NPDC048720]|uniref:hypothetical protein n=1 Tax=Streptomyces sp. NPDC048720 TaxID=3365588 RepID=UPI00371D27A7
MRDALLGLADNPALPAGLFARLMASGDDEVQYTLATRERLTPSQVRSLLADGDASLTCLLVRSGLVPWPDVPRDHPGWLLDAVLGGVAPAAGWRDAAADPDAEVRQEVACALDAPVEVIASLAHDPDPRVVADAAGNPRLPPELLPDLARHPSTVVRQAVAGHEAVPPALLAALLADGGQPAPSRCGACHGRDRECADHAPGIRRVRLAAAGHPAVPYEGLAAFLDAPETWTVATFAARPDLPADFLTRLAAHPSDDVRAAVAANPAVPEGVLRALAADPANEVRRAVAENPAVPLDLLIAVAAHERLPTEPAPRVESAGESELRTLARSRVAQVRALVADRTHLPARLAEQLACAPDIAVARRIAARPELDPERLAALVERHGPPVFAAVARHPGCTAALLHRMAADPAVTRRAMREIARHPATRSETLLLCLAGQDPAARHHAAAHPALALSALETVIDAADGSLARAAASNPALPEATMERVIARSLGEGRPGTPPADRAAHPDQRRPSRDRRGQ